MDATRRSVILTGVKATAKYFGVTERQARHWQEHKRIPTFRFGGQVCARDVDLHEMMAELAEKARAARVTEQPSKQLPTVNDLTRRRLGRCGRAGRGGGIEPHRPRRSVAPPNPPSKGPTTKSSMPIRLKPRGRGRILLGVQLPVAEIDDRGCTQEVGSGQVVAGDVADDRVVGSSDGSRCDALPVSGKGKAPSWSEFRSLRETNFRAWTVPFLIVAPAALTAGP